MNLEPLVLRDALRMCMSQECHNDNDVAMLTGLSHVTIYNIRKGKVSRPTENSRQAIEEYLACHKFKRGDIINGLEANPGFEYQQEAEAALLEKIGITNNAKEFAISSQQEGRHYVCTFLDDWECASVIGGIMASNLDENCKREIIGKLFPKEYPKINEEIL